MDIVEGTRAATVLMAGSSPGSVREARAFLLLRRPNVLEWARLMHDGSFRRSSSSPIAPIAPPGGAPALVVVDLFCGAGGLSLAFHRAGFRIAAAVEQDKNAAKTYQKSFIGAHSPGTALLAHDIRDAKVREALKELCSPMQHVDVVIGGPPCQDFSPARLKKPREKHRTSLVREYFKILELLKPKAFLFENVPGLRTATSGYYWNVVRKESRRLGYELSSEELKAEDFGVPQRRHRLFVVGLEKSLGRFTFPIGQGKAPTVMETIGKLMRLKAGESDPADPMHRARAHRPETVAYLMKLKEGEAWRDVAHVRVLDCHSGNHNGHYDVYGRMRGDTIAPTMTGGCTNPSKGRFTHPQQHRGLTVREAALLQTFPADWQFFGGVESASQQVGNAVPVKLGEYLAHALRTALRG